MCELYQKEEPRAKSSLVSDRVLRSGTLLRSGAACRRPWGLGGGEVVDHDGGEARGEGVVDGVVRRGVEADGELRLAELRTLTGGAAVEAHHLLDAGSLGEGGDVDVEVEDLGRVLRLVLGDAARLDLDLADDTVGDLVGGEAVLEPDLDLARPVGAPHLGTTLLGGDVRPVQGHAAHIEVAVHDLDGRDALRHLHAVAIAVTPGVLDLEGQFDGLHRFSPWLSATRRVVEHCRRSGVVVSFVRKRHQNHYHPPHTAER